MKRFLVSGWILLCSFYLLPDLGYSQSNNQNMTLDECIKYALQNEPTLQQQKIAEQITQKDVQINLADWYPQINFNYDITHYIELQTSIIPNQNRPGEKIAAKFGLKNNSNLIFSATQTIFNNNLRLASRTAPVLRQQASQNVTASKIDVVVNVSKAFFDLFITMDQLSILDEDIVRLERNLRDTYNQYESGITDKIDYKRATIALNSARSQKKAAQESIIYKTAVLKQTIGYPAENDLVVAFDTASLRQAAIVDTLQTLEPVNRIEYQQLQTSLKLQETNLSYYRWAFLPTLSAIFTHDFLFLNDNISDLYNRSYPYTYYGLRLSVPLFQGFKRLRNVQKAELQIRSFDWQQKGLKNQINSEYRLALANYKSAVSDWKVLEENEEIARDVYNTVNLQYKEGIKQYLEVIVAETDLRSAQLDARNALLRVISSKYDILRAMGTVPYNE
ncbi:TolC family protein [Cytophagaceae bacterium DM2B3-1]|uniref:TolC family protein n=1 Tax=Xanthocytophaga flava TaxID=3048013 RepID=A0ABT7CNP1_9BACT|nr:TolC family protein [Xanthocytophaga flavus]MDJ1495341.1 TolC family protein [Xanthocytophaga flavus]